ncbi:pimeloyl-ACP methyl ester carboxylesterase [Fontibacillus phaseoli]|uniref:Pimeloyl-ACP methyl ester carboxylesterase n=1 Tax=Fontibacillus phaseoli TaxID=1416533 RepID=A0A369BQ59_9BACL|nr:alpha/beta hydrolase [Fontibacillus phaseoli]RCX23185.1 pimeloyl-ACP methyl ester carboxylesterase [Fontibacillus phaseoli]
MKEGMLNIEGGQLFYTVSGEGEPIVLIHGNFNDHQIWNGQVDFFSAHYKLVRYDLRGYGLSSTPNATFSNIDDLKALIDSLKLRNIALVGSSMGGGIATDFTLTYPHLVKTLILVAPSINGNPYPMKLLWHGIKNFIHLRLKGRKKAIESFIVNPFWSYFFPPLRKVEARTQLIDNVRNPNNFCRFSPSLSAAVKPYAFNRLHEINIPTLIIIPDQDHSFNIETAKTLHKRIELSSKITMHGCGHLPFIEAPHEFNQTVFDFLSKSSLT